MNGILNRRPRIVLRGTVAAGALPDANKYTCLYDSTRHEPGSAPPSPYKLDAVPASATGPQRGAAAGQEFYITLKPSDQAVSIVCYKLDGGNAWNLDRTEAINAGAVGDYLFKTAATDVWIGVLAGATPPGALAYSIVIKEII